MNTFRGIFISAIGMIHVINGGYSKPLAVFKFEVFRYNMLDQKDIFPILQKNLKTDELGFIEKVSEQLAHQFLSRDEIFKILHEQSLDAQKKIAIADCTNTVDALIVQSSRLNQEPLNLRTRYYLCRF